MDDTLKISDSSKKEIAVS